MDNQENVEIEVIDLDTLDSESGSGSSDTF